MRLKLLLLGALLTTGLDARAVDFIRTNVFTVAADETVVEEQWVSAGIGQIDGVYENDLHILTGNPLQLNGVFKGNVAGMATMEANMTGRVARNLRLASSTVRINGFVGGNLMAIGDTIVLGTNAVVLGDALLFANTVVQEGVIHGDARISAARVATFSGLIKGDVNVTANEMLFPRDARIEGDFHYRAPKKLDPAEGVIGGDLLKLEPPSLFAARRLKAIARWFFAALLAGVPFIALFPMTTAMAAQLVRRSPWKCLFVGMLASLAVPTFALMSVSTIVGIPLGALMLAAWGIVYYLSRVIMALVIGTLILRSIGGSISRVLLSMALGLAVIYATTILPTIGLPVQLMVLFMGMGSLILAQVEKRRLILKVPANLKQLEALRDEKFNPEEK